MGDAIDTGNEALRRELVDETLEECERLLAAAEADATEIRHVAQRHAQERAEGAARALTAAAERLHQEATVEHESALEARNRADRHLEEAERLRDRMDGELAAATTSRDEGEAAIATAREESERLTALAESRLAEVAALQAQLESERDELAANRDIEAERHTLEHLERLEAEAAERVAEAERAAAERVAQAEAAAASRLAAVDDEVARLIRDRLAETEQASTALLDDARRMAADLLGDAERQATKQLDDASEAAGALLAAAQQQASELAQAARVDPEATGETKADRHAGADEGERSRRALEVERAANDRLAQADSDATRKLLDALEEARRIVTSAEAEAAEIRARAEAHARPRSEVVERPAPGPSVEADPPQVASPQRRRGRWQRGVRVTLLVGAILAASALLRYHVATPYTVAQSSMEPALSEGDRLVLNKVAYTIGEPERGDVVVFDTTDVPGAEGAAQRTVVKRVVGLPGEEVQGLDDRLVVDGEVIDDPWHGSAPTPAFGPILVPEGMVFVLGDNRALSVDSRIFGAVPIDALTGRVDVVVWPPGRAGRV